nr:hypothetical protein [Pseudonocardia sulfidoxydans]
MLPAEVLDAAAQVGVAVEERMGDNGFASDGLERDRLAAFAQAADGRLRGSDLGFGARPRSRGE